MASSGNNVIDPSAGAKQAHLRDHNERLVLTLVRRHGSLSKSELAKRSGFSAQTASVITNALEQDGLLLRGEPQRGKVGQPTIPLRLNPEGAYSIGINAGRRSAELVLVNFLGDVCETRRQTYAYPTPNSLLTFASEAVDSVRKTLGAEQQNRIAGIGLSMPNELWNWAERIGAPAKAMAAWKDANVESDLATRTGLPTFLRNDATSACGAELTFGKGTEYANFLYFFVGTFIGGGVVLDHAVFTGPHGYAGALGPMPVTRPGHDEPQQLLETASIRSLEAQLERAGLDSSAIWSDAEYWDLDTTVLSQWVDDTAYHIAWSAMAACSVIDFEAVIVDGAFPPSVRARLVKAMRHSLGRFDRQGLIEPDICEGTLGRRARALGGATLPLFSRYLLDQSVLRKVS